MLAARLDGPGRGGLTMNESVAGQWLVSCHFLQRFSSVENEIFATKKRSLNSFIVSHFPGRAGEPSAQRTSSDCEDSEELELLFSL